MTAPRPAQYPPDLMAGQWARRPLPGTQPARRRLHPAPALTQPRPAAPPELLTVAEVATACRVSRMTVYRLIHDRDIPAIRVGRSFRVPAAGLRAYLEQVQP